MARVALAGVIGDVLDRTGAPLEGITVTLANPAGSAPTVYSASTGTTTATATTDSYGQVQGYVEEGTYTYSWTNTSGTVFTGVVEAVSARGGDWVDVRSFGALSDDGAGAGTDSGVALQAAITYAQNNGGLLRCIGQYATTTTLTVAPDKPLVIEMGGMALGGSVIAPSRIRRKSGTNTVLSCVGTGQTSSTRARIEIRNGELNGGGGALAGTVLDLQRVQNVHLHRLRIADSGGTGLHIKEAYNCSGSDLYIHACGAGTGAPAMLMDAVASASGGSATVQFTNMEFEGNGGTDLKLTGDTGTSSPTNNVQCTNVKMESGTAAAVACPYIDLDYAQNCQFSNVYIAVHGDADRTAVPIKQVGTSAGARANQFTNLFIDVTQATTPTYLIQHGVGTLELGVLGFSQNTDVGTASIRVDSTVGVQSFRWAPELVASSSAKILLSDARTGPTRASAATITAPQYADVFTVTGTTNVTSVDASWPGRRITIIFTGILTFTDGSNLKLAGNFVTTADDAITLVCDGTNWYETSRSVN